MSNTKKYLQELKEEDYIAWDSIVNDPYVTGVSDGSGSSAILWIMLLVFISGFIIFKKVDSEEVNNKVKEVEKVSEEICSAYDDGLLEGVSVVKNIDNNSQYPELNHEDIFISIHIQKTKS